MFSRTFYMEDSGMGSDGAGASSSSARAGPSSASNARIGEGNGEVEKLSALQGIGAQRGEGWEGRPETIGQWKALGRDKVVELIQWETEEEARHRVALWEDMYGGPGEKHNFRSIEFYGNMKGCRDGYEGRWTDLQPGYHTDVEEREAAALNIEQWFLHHDDDLDGFHGDFVPKDHRLATEAKTLVQRDNLPHYEASVYPPSKMTGEACKERLLYHWIVQMFDLPTEYTLPEGDNIGRCLDRARDQLARNQCYRLGLYCSDLSSFEENKKEVLEYLESIKDLREDWGEQRRQRWEEDTVKGAALNNYLSFFLDEQVAREETGEEAAARLMGRFKESCVRGEPWTKQLVANLEVSKGADLKAGDEVICPGTFVALADCNELWLSKQLMWVLRVVEAQVMVTPSTSSTAPPGAGMRGVRMRAVKALGKEQTGQQMLVEGETVIQLEPGQPAAVMRVKAGSLLDKAVKNAMAPPRQAGYAPLPRERPPSVDLTGEEGQGRQKQQRMGQDSGAERSGWSMSSQQGFGHKDDSDSNAGKSRNQGATQWRWPDGDGIERSGTRTGGEAMLKSTIFHRMMPRADWLTYCPLGEWIGPEQTRRLLDLQALSRQVGSTWEGDRKCLCPEWEGRISAMPMWGNKEVISKFFYGNWDVHSEVGIGLWAFLCDGHKRIPWTANSTAVGRRSIAEQLWGLGFLEVNLRYAEWGKMLIRMSDVMMQAHGIYSHLSDAVIAVHTHQQLALAYAMWGAPKDREAENPPDLSIEGSYVKGVGGRGRLGVVFNGEEFWLQNVRQLCDPTSQFYKDKFFQQGGLRDTFVRYEDGVEPGSGVAQAPGSPMYTAPGVPGGGGGGPGTPGQTVPPAVKKTRDRTLRAGDKGYCAFDLAKQMGIKTPAGKLIECYRGVACSLKHDVDMTKMSKGDYADLAARTIPVPPTLMAEFQARS